MPGPSPYPRPQKIRNNLTKTQLTTQLIGLASFKQGLIERDYLLYNNKSSVTFLLLYMEIAVKEGWYNGLLQPINSLIEKAHKSPVDNRKWNLVHIRIKQMASNFVLLPESPPPYYFWQ